MSAVAQADSTSFYVFFFYINKNRNGSISAHVKTCAEKDLHLLSYLNLFSHDMLLKEKNSHINIMWNLALRSMVPAFPVTSSMMHVFHYIHMLPSVLCGMTNLYL